jgi:GDP-L-fucose synthase
MRRNEFQLSGKRVWVAGHAGMVGAALTRRLEQENCEIVTVAKGALDLRRQAEVEEWIDATRPEAVFVCAALVGGIVANDQRPADFLYDNLMIEANIIRASYTADVQKLLFLGSSCIYPRLAPQPMPEDALLTGPLEPTNQWYALAKIAGVKLCEAYRKQHGLDYISAMPTNLYGPGDNFDLTTSHVVPALIRKAYLAKQASVPLQIWGTGEPRREFLFVEDLADALVFLMKRYSEAQTINVGAGTDLTIRELASEVAAVVGFEGEIVCDTSKPDGTPRKFLDSSRLSALGWSARTSLRAGLAKTYEWFLDNAAHVRGVHQELSAQANV